MAQTPFGRPRPGRLPLYDAQIRRWRPASNNITPAATDTFRLRPPRASESRPAGRTAPGPGAAAPCLRRRARWRSGSVRSPDVVRSGASPAKPDVHTPALFSSSSARAMFTTVAIRTCASAPADAFADDAVERGRSGAPGERRRARLPHPPCAGSPRRCADPRSRRGRRAAAPPNRRSRPDPRPSSRRAAATSATMSWCTPPRAIRDSVSASTRSTGTFTLAPAQSPDRSDGRRVLPTRSRCTRPPRRASSTGLRP